MSYDSSHCVEKEEFLQCIQNRPGWILTPVQLTYCPFHLCNRVKFSPPGPIQLVNWEPAPLPSVSLTLRAGKSPCTQSVPDCSNLFPSFVKSCLIHVGMCERRCWPCHGDTQLLSDDILNLQTLSSTSSASPGEDRTLNITKDPPETRQPCFSTLEHGQVTRTWRMGTCCGEA